jgi:hypothetical protein
MQNKQKEIMAMAQGLLKIKATSVKDVLDGHYLRRTHEVEEEKLPPLNAIIQVLEFTYPEERALYELVQDLYARRLDVDVKNRARLMEGIIHPQPQIFDSYVLFLIIICLRLLYEYILYSYHFF